MQPHVGQLVSLRNSGYPRGTVIAVRGKATLGDLGVEVDQVFVSIPEKGENRAVCIYWLPHAKEAEIIGLGGATPFAFPEGYE